MSPLLPALAAAFAVGAAVFGWWLVRHGQPADALAPATAPASPTRATRSGDGAAAGSVPAGERDATAGGNAVELAATARDAAGEPAATARGEAGQRDAPARGNAVERVSELVGGLLQPVLDALLGPAQLAAIERRLLAAGRPDDLSVERYLRRSIGTALMGVAVGLSLASMGQPVAGMLVGLAIAVSNEIWLRSAVNKRQRRLARELPDFLDVLAVALGAGLGLRSALVRAADTLGGALAEEVRGTVRAMDVGVDWRTAMERLRERNPAPPLQRFVGAVIQAESLGAPLAAMVRDQAQQIRVEAGQAARQRAARAEPRVVAITAAFLVPAILVLLIAAFGLSIAESTSDVLG